MQATCIFYRPLGYSELPPRGSDNYMATPTTNRPADNDDFDSNIQYLLQQSNIIAIVEAIRHWKDRQGRKNTTFTHNTQYDIIHNTPAY